VIGAALGVDAIQEFSVLTGGFSAEYGKASGGVVNAITKSGTNGFHGDVYEFLRNSALDSRDYFSRAATLHWPSLGRNQFGACGGWAHHQRTKHSSSSTMKGFARRRGLRRRVMSFLTAHEWELSSTKKGRLTDQHACSFQGWTQAGAAPKAGTYHPLARGKHMPSGSKRSDCNSQAPGQAGFLRGMTRQPR